MKRFAYCITVLHLIAAVAFSQPVPDTLWTRTYGGTSHELARSIAQTTDGGYVIAGQTYSFGAGDYDFYVVKTNSTGDTLWTRTYGGSLAERAYDIRQTTDGGYVIAGGFGDNASIYVVKTNSNGDTLWTRTYGGDSFEEGYSIRQTTDGGYVIAGFTMSSGAGSQDFYVVKTDSTGDTLWTRTYGGSLAERAFDIRQTTDGGYVIAGYTSSSGAGGGDFYLVKTNSTGVTLWSRTYGGSNHEQAQSVQQTSDGGYVMAGLTGSFGAGVYDIYVVKTDSAGDTLRTHTYGGNNYDQAFSIEQTADDGYVIAGNTNSFGAGSYDGYVLRSDRFGDTLWTRTYGGSGDDRAYSVKVTADSGYVIAGSTSSFGAGGTDMYVVKTGTDRIDLWAPGLPRVAITIEDTDVRMYWNPVTETIGGYPIEVTRYLVFFSEQFAGPYWFHGSTADTNYTHVTAVHWASNMFYRVIASTAPALVFDELPMSSQNPPLSEEQVLEMLRDRDHPADKRSQ